MIEITGTLDNWKTNTVYRSIKMDKLNVRGNRRCIWLWSHISSC